LDLAGPGAAAEIAPTGEPPLDARVSRLRREGNGVPRFATVGAALQAAPSDGARPFRIGIDIGVWREKLVIDKPNIHLLGADRQRCVLSFDAAAGMPDANGKPWGTWGCASIIVRASDFRAENLSMQNSFDYVGSLGSPQFEPIGSNGLQAVALMLDAGADRSMLRDVDLIGHQDTLFVDAGRSLFRDCRISGSVDFVFGAGQALFQHCELVSRFRPDKPRQGYVAVPSTLATQPHGLLFERCRLLRESGVPDASVVLGRPWRPTRGFADGRYGDPAVLGSAVFMHCWMDAHIAAEGWEPMAYSAADGTRVLLQPNEARLFEFGSEGPGAQRSPTRRWLDAESARQHRGSGLLGEWAVDAT
jgi:pectinesterase